MYRRKVIVTAAAIFAIGVAFAAQPTSLHADWAEATIRQGTPWVPGSDKPMSAYEPGVWVVAPPH
jgi:hypothetical protein